MSLPAATTDTGPDPFSDPPRGRPISFGFVPALDGMRAIAVFGVMLYHGGAPGVGGGFLGVNVFFVLSGFLITSLLLGEWTTRLTIRLGEFWARRARRLLPALLVLLVGVAVYAKFFASPGQFPNLRLDTLSSLFYVANWHFIFAGSSYFDQTVTSPLAHMWSLAIEEQFYIVWPPVVLVLLRLGSKLRPSRRLLPVLAVATAGALASAVWMRVLFLHGASATRLYEGTDTRSQDILVGAVLATAMAMWARARPALAARPVPDGRSVGRFDRLHPAVGTAGALPPRPHRRDLHRRRGPSLKPIAAWEIASPAMRGSLQLVGFAALASGAYLWSRLTGPSAWLFEGGFFAFALLVALVIFCIVTAQAAPLSRALGNRVFRYLGKISYGTYLWHYPLFALLSAERVHLYGLPLLAVRIGITLLVATGSYYLVEQPIRRGRVRSFTEWRAWLLTSFAFLGVVSVTVATTLPTAAGAVGTGRIPAPSGSVYVGRPVSVSLFGDSLAFTAGFALSTPGVAAAYDVQFHPGGLLGCGIMVVSDQIVQGNESHPYSACDASAPPSQQWPAIWSGWLGTNRPNVVMLMAGRWEVADEVIDGQDLHIGEPAFDSVLRADLERAVAVATSTGAYLMLVTAPCTSSGEQPNGQPWPEDTTSRRLLYDQMLRQVAAEHPSNVEVDDFGAQVCPSGKFTTTVDGVTVRLADGVHFPGVPGSTVPVLPAAKWLAWKLFPEAVRVGRLQMTKSPLR
jgi:peptidoglycan/LPS O-acetylase OafA/YrhL